MSKAFQLTDDDRAQIEHYTKACEADFLSTEPANRKLAEAAIFRIYRRLGRNMPRVVWTKSPFESSICIALIHKCSGLYLNSQCLKADFNKLLGVNISYQDEDEISSIIKTSHLHQMTDSIFAKLQEVQSKNYEEYEVISGFSTAEDPNEKIIRLDNDSPMIPVMKYARDTFWNYIEKTAEDFFYEAEKPDLEQKVWDYWHYELSGTDNSYLIQIPGFGFYYSMGNEVYENHMGRSHRTWARRILGRYHKQEYWQKHWSVLKYTAYKNLRRYLPFYKRDNRSEFFGQNWASTLAYNRFLSKTGFLEGNDQIADLAELSQSAGHIEPFEKICFISERHSAAKFDDAGRLHCEDGPALAYRDGYESYAWHGTQFPKEWITKKPTASEALSWYNLEQRRVACELVGWSDIIDRLKGRLVDKDDDPEIGELIRVALPDSRPETFLRVTCGTGRRFALPVPPEMRTARQANAWTWGLEPHQYKPEVRT